MKTIFFTSRSLSINPKSASRVTTFLSAFTFLLFLFVGSATSTFAFNKPQDAVAYINKGCDCFNKTEVDCITSLSDNTNDSYLMVMQQQVEKGDLSITMSFYMDQMTNLYKMSQLSADMQINHGFYLNNFTQIEPALLTSADQFITDDFMQENAE